MDRPIEFPKYKNLCCEQFPREGKFKRKRRNIHSASIMSFFYWWDNGILYWSSNDKLSGITYLQRNSYIWWKFQNTKTRDVYLEAKCNKVCHLNLINLDVTTWDAKFHIKVIPEHWKFMHLTCERFWSSINHLSPTTFPFPI